MATLTINAGSSSLKFGIFDGLRALLRGQVEGLGNAATLIHSVDGGPEMSEHLSGSDMTTALERMLQLAEASGIGIDAVGHRIVHGGLEFDRPVVLNEAVISALQDLEPLAPLHQPFNIACIRAAKVAFPSAAQIGCFDTAFHRQHPYVNDTFALPYEYYEAGVRRYGFHGLSYEYITGYLQRNYPSFATGKVVVIHLGAGASMCAINAGDSVASTMGFSALDGLPMGTRCGQLDPGVILWMMQARGMNADEIADVLYRQSGLKGLSGMSNDMRALQASDDVHAKQAIDYFVFRIRRELGAMAAVLQGLDTLVFCGGIGENSAIIRERICDGFQWMDVILDDAANQAGARDISTPASHVSVLRIETDEEQMIARHVAALVG